MTRVLWRKEREKFLHALSSIDTSSPSKERNSLRNRAMLIVAYDTGCRVAELCALDVNDFDSQHKTLMIVNVKAKGKPRRQVPLHNKTVRYLRAWLKVRPELDTQAMFISQKNARISIRQVSNVYLKVCESAGLSSEGIHTLRHTSATRLLDDNVLPVHQLSRRLGHRSIGTTYKFYVHGSIEEEANAIQKHRM